MLEIRCSESEAVMRMRGMPSVCIFAKRVCGACDANIRLRRIVFMAFAKKLTRLALRIEWRVDFHAACTHAYDRDRWSLSIFKTRVLFWRDMKCDMKKRNARASRFDFCAGAIRFK